MIVHRAVLAKGSDKRHTLAESSARLDEEVGRVSADVPAAVAGLSGLPLLSDTGQNRSPLTTSYLQIEDTFAKGVYSHSKSERSWITYNS